jgi:hypothetical protein
MVDAPHDSQAGVAEGAIEVENQCGKRIAHLDPWSSVPCSFFRIEHGLPLFFSDKDFKPFVHHSGLAEAR